MSTEFEHEIVEQISQEEAQAFLYKANELKNEVVCIQYTTKKPKGAPSIKLSIDVPNAPISRAFNLEFTLFGFNVANVNNNGINAYSIFNKNLALDFPVVDIEFLRGLAALALTNLETKLNQHIDISDMIYSPRFTEYLYNCMEFISMSK